MNYSKVQGSQEAAGLRIAVLQSRFNEFITEALANAALQVIAACGCAPDQVTFVKVPGAWELPVAAKHLAASFDAIIAIGAVVRGDTPHFEYVAAAAAQGLQQVSTETGVPIGFGVLTTNTMQQAMDRAGGKSGNKGAEAAEAAIEMATLIRKLKEAR